MKEHNIVGTSKGYLERVLNSYKSVQIRSIRKYFLSSLKFMNLYLDGETGFTVNKRMADLRKCHRRPVELEVDHSQKAYNRDRI